MFTIASIIVLAATVAAVTGHYLLFGPRRRDVDGSPRAVPRFGMVAIVLHAVLVLSFLVLAGTGAISAATGQPLRGWPLMIHVAGAACFPLALALVAIVWAGACAFEGHDWQWIRSVGGYLGGPQDLPADRFNAGQKGFLWAVVALGLAVILSGLGRLAPVLGPCGQAVVLEVHRYAALLLTVAFVVHLYLATIANPGTLLAMLTGRVSADWAAHHHPLWWERKCKDRKESKEKGVPTDV